MKSDLIVFGEDWNGHPSSTQHLVRRMMRERQVLWVNSIGLRRPRLCLSDFARLGRKAAAIVRRRRTPGPMPAAGPIVVDPKAVPFPGNPLARRVNRWLLRETLREPIRRHGIERPILWTSLPTAVDVVGELNERAVVYYCGDDFSALAGVDHAAVAGLEAELAGKADLILAASPALARKFPAERTHIVPHGVDFDLFATPAPRPADLPADGPVAGFYGSISEWLDLDTMAETARRMPHWRFVFVGPLRTDTTVLDNLDNVFFLGPRPHRDLPGYVRNWDASLLPFLDTPQIRACNPLKLREYLAAGTPVVATDFPALDGYRDLVAVVDGPGALARALEGSLGEPEERKAARRQRVAGESWEARAAMIDELLRSL
jgi:glycosyltransferase involved in cell wall biosynthesis